MGWPSGGAQRVGPKSEYSWELAENLPAAAYLADGGIWNNLGTQWFEDTWERQIPIPEVDRSLEIPLRNYLIVVDASGPVGASSCLPLRVPLLAEFVSLIRSMSILYVNTVLPRVEALWQRVSDRFPATGRGAYSVVAWRWSGSIYREMGAAAHPAREHQQHYGGSFRRTGGPF